MNLHTTLRNTSALVGVTLLAACGGGDLPFDTQTTRFEALSDAVDGMPQTDLAVVNGRDSTATYQGVGSVDYRPNLASDPTDVLTMQVEIDVAFDANDNTDAVTGRLYNWNSRETGAVDGDVEFQALSTGSGFTVIGSQSDLTIDGETATYYFLPIEGHFYGDAAEYIGGDISGYDSGNSGGSNLDGTYIAEEQ